MSQSSSMDGQQHIDEVNLSSGEEVVGCEKPSNVENRKEKRKPGRKVSQGVKIYISQSNPKKRHLKAGCCDHFEPFTNSDDGSFRGRCIYCPKAYQADSSKNEVKRKNTGQMERRNIRALADITNLGKIVPGVETGKATQISLPITRNFQLACGITTKSKDSVVNIDELDANNELAEVEYVEDIYRFYKLSETGLSDYMSSQPDLNAEQRAILIDWLVEVHRKFKLMPESLYLTINVVDRYLSVTTVPQSDLQLVGISAMLMACKYEEIWPPEVNDLITISDNAYSRDQILAMEKALLGRLGWFLTVPTPYVFLVRYTKASLPSDSEMENMVFFLTELGLMDYSIIMTNNPSKLAASAVYAARCTLNKTPAWTETLKHHTDYNEDELKDWAKSLVSFHAGASENKLKAVYTKFANPEKGAVALFPPAKNLVAEIGSAGLS